MNRIVLIGNGFDLAHGLATRYEDFINWYWDQRTQNFSRVYDQVSEDCLCTFKIDEPYTWKGFYNQIISPLGKPKGKDIIKRIRMKQYGSTISASFTPFFGNIINSIESKGWVDIENEYYRELLGCTIVKTSKISLNELNEQFNYITKRLIEYLSIINSTSTMKVEGIWDNIYSPIKPEDVSIEGRHVIQECIDEGKSRGLTYQYHKARQFGIEPKDYIDEIHAYIKGDQKSIPRLYMMPNQIMLLNFNYTDTSDIYQKHECSFTIHIHGHILNPSSIIFGYGDELDENYKILQALNENECLRNIKSIKYLESDNYRNVLKFLESEPFQVLIMGHSCGNSDRTLLNTIFEHKNCISIKPFYYKKDEKTDDYLDKVQNISRNFTDMKLMRDRVVNKTYCEPLPQTK